MEINNQSESGIRNKSLAIIFLLIFSLFLASIACGLIAPVDNKDLNPNDVYEEVMRRSTQTALSRQITSAPEFVKPPEASSPEPVEPLGPSGQPEGYS